MSKELKEGCKEILRTSLMAIVPLAIINLQQNTFDWKAFGVAALIAILSGIDKFLHKLEIGVKGNGLTGV